MSCTNKYLKGKIAEAVVGKVEPPPDELLGKAIDEKLASNIEEFLEENVCNIICKMFEKHQFTEEQLKRLLSHLKKM